MLPFREQEIKPAELPVRWKIGIDQRQVALYVGLALVAGFTLGFATSRYITNKEAATAEAVAKLNAPPRPPAEAVSPTDFRRVVRLRRADTLEIEGAGVVRMIGIETPDGKSQYVEPGKRALAFAEKMLLGQSVRIETDPATAARDHKDEEGNTLAYVYTQDGTMANKELIRQGHAFVRASESFRLAEEFRAQERDAMASMRGVWGLGGSSTEVGSSAGPTATGDPLAQTGDKPRRLSPLAPDAVGPNVPAISGATVSSEPVVLVSSSDRMYHRTGCEYLASKKSSISLSEARGKGYAACGRCFASTVLKAP